MYDEENQLLYFDVTNVILKCCFEVMNTLGSGFLESVYKNALIISIAEKGLNISTDKRFTIVFKNQTIGVFIPDLIIENKVIVELKCCDYLLLEHQAQLINYLKVVNCKVGLLVNFGTRRLDYKRLHHPAYPAALRSSSSCSK